MQRVLQDFILRVFWKIGIICDIWKTKAELKKVETKVETKVTPKDRRIKLEPVPGNQGVIHVEWNQW